MTLLCWAPAPSAQTAATTLRSPQAGTADTTGTTAGKEEDKQPEHPAQLQAGRVAFRRARNGRLWGINVSEGGLHLNPNARWLVFSHLRACRERGCGPVDPVDNDRVCGFAGADRGHGVLLHGQPGWVAALTPLSVGGMIVAASTTLLADSRVGERGGVLSWTLLVVALLTS